MQVAQGNLTHTFFIEFAIKNLFTSFTLMPAATTEAGKFLGINYGFIEGSQASFVILDASPIENILNPQKIHMVIHHGVVVNQDKLLKQSFE